MHMSGAQSAAADIDVDLRQLFASLIRNWVRILVVALAVAGLAFALASLATPAYKAETKLLIETRESVFTRPSNNNEADRPMLDAEGIASQVELIASTDILKQVATKLNLSRLPEFDEAADMGALGRFLIIAGLKNDPNEIPPEERVLKAMREKLKVYPVERSRVIVIEFSSEDPKLAAAIPNAIADAYISEQGDAKIQSNSAATDWLAPEIADLSKRVRDAEAKVADYRAQAGLLMGGNNSVLATQQLSELSSELSRVRANRASAEATADSVRSALRNGGSLDAFPEVLSSSLIQRLREQRVQLKSNIADLSTTLLENHPRIRALRSQLTDLDGQIRIEAQKVLKGLTNEAQTARMRESQLVADLNGLKAESARAGDDQVELNALEREATAQRQLLESYMTRFREASSRKDRNYLPVDARVFSRAVTPSEPYYPKIGPIVAAAFVASLLIMAVTTLLQELFSGRAMRPAAGSALAPVEQVEMPVAYRATNEGSVSDDANGDVETLPQAPAAAPSVSSPNLLHWAGVAEPVAQEEPKPSVLGEVDVERAAEKLIAGGATRAIFVSPQGDEAAASSVLVAREIADAGLRVLLLDMTASGAASRPMLDTGLLPGITNLLASEAQFSDVIHTDHYSACHVIPVGTADPMRSMRAADRLPIIMQSLTTAYDLVVVECGATDAHGIRRLVADGAHVMMSVIEPDDDVAQAAVQLIESGYPDLTLVTPIGRGMPGAPLPDRRTAA